MPLTSGPRGWPAGPTMHTLTGWLLCARSPGGGNKEYKVGSQWKPNLVATRPCGHGVRPTPGALPTLSSR
jgi:hypothetical protein